MAEVNYENLPEEVKRCLDEETYVLVNQKVTEIQELLKAKMVVHEDKTKNVAMMYFTEPDGKMIYWFNDQETFNNMIYWLYQTRFVAGVEGNTIN